MAMLQKSPLASTQGKERTFRRRLCAAAEIALLLLVPLPATLSLPPFLCRKRSGYSDSAMDVAVGIPDHIVCKGGIP